MAEKLGMSRVSYENKKKSGKFTALEAKKLCKLFKVKFDYLFETKEEEQRGEKNNCKRNHRKSWKLFKRKQRKS